MSKYHPSLDGVRGPVAQPEMTRELTNKLVGAYRDYDSVRIFFDNLDKCTRFELVMRVPEGFPLCLPVSKGTATDIVNDALVASEERLRELGGKLS